MRTLRDFWNDFDGVVDFFNKNGEEIDEFYDTEGNPMLPYYNADTVEELLEEVCEY